MRLKLLFFFFFKVRMLNYVLSTIYRVESTAVLDRVNFSHLFIHQRREVLNIRNQNKKPTDQFHFKRR